VALVAALLGTALTVALLGGPGHQFLDALARAASSQPQWVAAAVVAEALSFTGYVALLWLVGSRATPVLDARTSYRLTLGGAAATRLLPTGGAGGIAFTLWVLRRTGLPAPAATRVLLTFLTLLYAVFFTGLAWRGCSWPPGLRRRGRPRRARRRRGGAGIIVFGLAAAAVRPLLPSSPSKADRRARGRRRRGPRGARAPAPPGPAAARRARVVGPGRRGAVAPARGLRGRARAARGALAYFAGTIANTSRSRERSAAA
jgi:hypothetical protein